MENSIDTYQFCEEILSQYEHGLSIEVDDFFQLLGEFSSKYDSLVNKLPYHINVIDELHVNENANSRILAALFKYKENGEHTILKSFITNLLKGWNIEVVKPEISSEDLRIDILVKETGKYAIIFENKIYDAILQKNQLARYIIKMRNDGYSTEQIYVVFLPPSYYEPNECSWKEPTKECEACSDPSMCQINVSHSLKSKYKERFRVITFREDIVNWLKEALIPNCRQKEVYLYTAAMQYLDYLEGYFDLRTINNTMNMELEKYLIEKLQLNELSDEKQLEVLNRKTSEINRLLNQMNSLKDVVTYRICVADVESWKPYLMQIQSITASVGKRFGLISEADFIFSDQDKSRFFIKYKKEHWDLSIVFEKYEYQRSQSFFVYIGIPGEIVVDSKYYPKDLIFSHKDERSSHPYGYDYLERYNAKPKELKNDIENGGFETFLMEQVGTILKQIEEKDLPMN